MKILVAKRKPVVVNEEVPNYAQSIVRVLREKGHDVLEVPKKRLLGDDKYKRFDLLIDIDCGRDEKGNLHWHCEQKPVPIPSVLILIDSHGYPTLHKRLAPNYTHVFFAVYSKRELFKDHDSAHWLPNFTDLKWFNKSSAIIRSLPIPTTHFGFFGSKGGLDRAKPLIKIAEKNGWTHDVRQISPGNKVRWPDTAKAMSTCHFLFNHGQKHDGPNLRVFESMAVDRPLICDQDPLSGLDLLFQPWEHYIPYEAYTYEGLERAMKFCIEKSDVARKISLNAFNAVSNLHLVEHRVEQILEVVNAKN